MKFRAAGVVQLVERHFSGTSVVEGTHLMCEVEGSNPSLKTKLCRCRFESYH